MERLTAFDGGRILKRGLLAFGALIWSAPAFAQSTDDSLVQWEQPKPAQTQATPPQIVQAPAYPVTSVQVPKDWRGVFDAIDAGNWSSARAGIAALPPNILTSVAKAELYTAKDSPAVDLPAL